MCNTEGHNPNNHASTVKIEELNAMNNRTNLKMNSQICEKPHQFKTTFSSNHANTEKTFYLNIGT